jgi:hydrogenase maturation protein HypF
MPADRIRLKIDIRGTVQGVGFRPFVYRHATALGLSGSVVNTGAGVVVQAEGDRAALASLIETIRSRPPPHARIAAVETAECATLGEASFTIGRSAMGGERAAEILPDLATCDDCLCELFDPADRRHRYPFINCTQCGPRYSIIEDLPYDRARTSMRRFPMCPACRAEYDDPANRRFHAEPNACPACGPHLALWDADGREALREDDALDKTIAALREGLIVALKGLGGFHLLADARNEAAVARLRVRKRRASKPFAVMFPSLAEIAESCRLSDAEAALVTGAEHPIVLLWRTGGPVAAAVAPGNPWLGVMLPYTPLHHLILHDLGFPIVATSGNLSDEPIAFDEAEAWSRLRGIADLFLVHDRPIARPVDDSVARIVCGRELVLRRARGFAPAPAARGRFAAGILALGGHLKSTIAVSRGAGILASQHVGDLDTPESRALHAQTAADATRLLAIEPRVVVRDLHPDYASSRSAERMGLPVVAVQHHVAHAAACLAEHGRTPPALGVVWDGTGYGPDGTIWGGEFLLLGQAGWRRFARLRPFRLPGGDVAAREPRRAALGLLYEAYGDRAFEMRDLLPLATFTEAELRILRHMLKSGLNAPLASSAGRLFDAIAALARLRQISGHEGQAAVELEGAAGGAASKRCYSFALIHDGGAASPDLTVDWAPALGALLADLRNGVAVAEISVAFHNGLAAAIAEVAFRAGEPNVVLSGGCFQNARLTETAVGFLRSAGFEPLWHRFVPPNDGGLAVGQAAWAAWMEQAGGTPCA